MSDLIEVKTADLIGLALDWAVAKAENVFVHISDPELGNDLRIFFVSGKCLPCVVKYMPSTDWRFGGPLIEKHVTALNQSGTESWWSHCEDRLGQGETPLIAAMRAIVAAKLGDTVSVPAELVKP